MPPSAQFRRRTIHWLLRGVLVAAACTDSTSPAAAPTKLVFGRQPVATTAGIAMFPYVSVVVETDRGDTSTHATDLIILTLTANVNGAQLVDTARAAAVHGVATFTNLRVRRAGQAYTLRATAAGLISATSAPFDITAAPAVSMYFSSQPDIALKSSPIRPTVMVVLVDSLANVATGYQDLVTIALAGNPTATTLAGTTSVHALSGVATFADLSIGQVGTGYFLRATAGALPSVETPPFMIVGAIATLRVTSSTHGAALDADGYSVCIDPTPDGLGGTKCLYGAPSALGVNSTLTTRADTGTHVVLLRGVEVNCTVSGDNPRSVSAAQNVTTDVSFAISCAQPTLRVTTATTGTTYDPAGRYSLCIDSDYYYGCGTYLSIGVNGSASMVLTPGAHQLSLDGVPENCIVSGGNNRSVVATGDMSVAFAIECLAAGSVRVTATTSGTDTGPNGYQACVDRENNPCYWVAAVPDAGTRTIPGVLVGAHTVTLTAVAENCTVSGGASRAVTMTANGIADVSFDVNCVTAERVAYVSGGTIFVLRVDGTGGVSLTGGAAPAWSPDGARLAFECNLDLCVINSDGSARAPLTIDQAGNRHPSWSPDGTRIAFASTHGGSTELYTMAASGSGVVQVTHGVGFRGSPAWSPDGQKIAFDCEVDAGNRDICSVNADGSGFTRITNDPASDHGPAWRPDGQAIAFATARSGSGDMTVLVSPAGGAVSPIGAGLFGYEPTWSPDGSQLAVTQLYTDYYGPDYPAVTAVRADGSNARLVGYGSQAAWRPHP